MTFNSDKCQLAVTYFSNHEIDNPSPEFGKMYFDELWFWLAVNKFYTTCKNIR